MPTDPSIWSSALQLGIGGLSVAGIIYVALQNSKTQKELQQQFLKVLDERADKHERAMMERETALRDVERNVRGTFAEIITKNTVTLTDVARALSRVVYKLGDEQT